MNDKYPVGTRLVLDRNLQPGRGRKPIIIGKVSDNHLIDEICVQWNTGETIFYEASWLDRHCRKIEPRSCDE